MRQVFFVRTTANVALNLRGRGEKELSSHPRLSIPIFFASRSVSFSFSLLPAGNSRKYRGLALRREGVSLPKGDAKLSPSVVRLGSQSQPRPQPIFGLWRFFFVFPSAHLHVMLTQILQPRRRRGAARRGVEDACGGGGGGVGGGGWWPLAVAVSVVAAAHAARR